MNRAISQGQAMRSILGRSRVIHFTAASFYEREEASNCILPNRGTDAELERPRRLTGRLQARHR